MNDQFAIIGRFVSSVNTFEFQINVILEIIFSYVRKENKSSLKTDLVDFFHESSINKRIELIYYSLLTLNIGNQDFDNEIEGILKLKELYNKEFQATRDSVAHNPLIDFDKEFRIVSSRRFKGKSDYIELEKLNELSDRLIEINKSSNELASNIQNKLKIEPIRDLPNN